MDTAVVRTLGKYFPGSYVAKAAHKEPLTGGTKHFCHTAIAFVSDHADELTKKSPARSLEFHRLINSNAVVVTSNIELYDLLADHGWNSTGSNFFATPDETPTTLKQGLTNIWYSLEVCTHKYMFGLYLYVLFVYRNVM